ncbi:MAG: O-antigen ligase family protein [Muribaculum sp.]|nr:O-antigen ligase family protein [Muribaculum sp.]
MLRKINYPYAVFCALFITYFLQGILYSMGGGISLSIGLCFLIFGIIYYFKYILQNSVKVKFISIWSLFYTLIAVTYVLSPQTVYGSGWTTTTLTQFKETSICCLPLFIGYAIGLKKNITEKQLLITYLVLLLVCCLRFYFRISLLVEGGLNAAKITNNESYNFVALFMFIPLFIKKYRIISIVAILISISFILAGVKRGAIVCTAVIFLYAMYKYQKATGFSIKYLIVAGVLVLAGLVYFQRTMEDNAYLQERFEKTLDGDSSGRDKIAENIWAAYCKFDVVRQVIGQGSSQSITYAGNYAHNDWLELLVDNGLLGVIIYISFYISFFKYINRHCKGDLQLALNIFGVFLLCKSVFSMGFTTAFLGICFLTVGVLVGINSRHHTTGKMNTMSQRT